MPFISMKKLHFCALLKQLSSYACEKSLDPFNRRKAALPFYMEKKKLIERAPEFSHLSLFSGFVLLVKGEISPSLVVLNPPSAPPPPSPVPPLSAVPPWIPFHSPQI